MMQINDLLRDRMTALGLNKPDGYNPYAAGAKQYGLSGRSNATSGPVGFDGQQGYQERDRQTRARKQATLQRLQAAQGGNYMSPAWLRGGRGA